MFARIQGSAARLKPFVGLYPWERLADADPARTLFVDIGSGHGHAVSAITAAHPELPPVGFVLQDLANVVSLAEQRNADLPKGVQFQAHDFFTPNPIEGAKVYHVRACLHDWPDSACVQILQNIVVAMAPDSRLLIAECLLTEDPREDETGLTGLQDMLMLCIGGKERTERAFEVIIKDAGLVLEQVWEGEKIGRFAVLECRIAGK